MVSTVSLSLSHWYPIGILGQVWYLIVSIPDLCTLTYFLQVYNFDFLKFRILEILIFHPCVHAFFFS